MCIRDRGRTCEAAPTLTSLTSRARSSSRGLSRWPRGADFRFRSSRLSGWPTLIVVNFAKRMPPLHDSGSRPERPRRGRSHRLALLASRTCGRSDGRLSCARGVLRGFGLPGLLVLLRGLLVFLLAHHPLLRFVVRFGALGAARPALSVGVLRLGFSGPWFVWRRASTNSFKISSLNVIPNVSKTEVYATP